jgi:hypothetical protein
MRFSYSDLISYCQDGANDTSSTIQTFFKRRINERYELVTDKLNTWNTVVTRTATSGTSGGLDQQYYAQSEWDLLNAEPNAEGASPTYYFRRELDYGIFPYQFNNDGTITINYTRRPMPLYFTDYTTGTAAVTENDQTVTLSAGVTTTFKPGLWFSLSDSSGEPRGSWYRILSITDSTNLELETFFEESTESGASYIIGQTPELPEEAHNLLAIGALSDFYALKKKDLEAATRFDNKFWSGNYNVTALQARKDGMYGGLLALIDAYKDRDDSVIVSRSPVSRDMMDFRTPSTATLS